MKSANIESLFTNLVKSICLFTFSLSSIHGFGFKIPVK
uniref:BLTX515 n=1 Tax=Nephila pilipes TaxID=299642 RepID=A0A076KU47_NEPPI|nr:BLTX515 [Nephila pilipes]